MLKQAIRYKTGSLGSRWVQLSLYYADRETIPSGALTLDIALGGGFPKGRIIEVGS